MSILLKVALVADESQTHFLRRLAEVKAKVDEPSGTRIKLNARPKPTIHLGGPKATVNGIGASSNAPNEGDVVKATVEGDDTPPKLTTRSVSKDARDVSTPPIIKTEAPIPTAASMEPPGPNSLPPEVKPSSTASMLPPPARMASTSPAPPLQSGSQPPPYVPALAPAPITFAETYLRKTPIADALLPKITLVSHPQLNVPIPYQLQVDASPDFLHKSVTIMLPPSQYFLQACPSVSQALSSGRQYKLFVHVNGIRATPSTKPLVNGDMTNGVERKPVYDVPLTPGTNRIEVEIAAVPTRGGSLEVEKLAVFANLMRY